MKENEIEEKDIWNRGKKMKTLIYCTKAKPFLEKDIYNKEVGYFLSNLNGSINFHSSDSEKGMNLEYELECCDTFNGKIVASFELDKIDRLECKEKYSVHYDGWTRVYNDKQLDDVMNKSCLKVDEIYAYGNAKDLYSWHIDNLKIFDKPMNLEDLNLNRAPQSWCYVYINGEKCILISINSEWVEKILSGKKIIEVRKSYPKEIEVK